MKISGFTIVRNAIKYRYPIIESINSILPICDEFIVNVGDSQDGTLELIESIKDTKIKIIQTIWNMNIGSKVLADQTNFALKECKGDWAFYLQSDEVVHERDLSKLVRCMQNNLNNTNVDVLRFKWFHFYGSHFRYRIDKGWYQKQDRIVRNNGQIRSMGDAFAFERVDGKKLKSYKTGCYIYHYGWVQSPEHMSKRKENAQNIGYASDKKSDFQHKYEYGDLQRFPIYFGTHPAVMKTLISLHPISLEDWKLICQRNWWNPLKILRIRTKTGQRVKTKIE